MKKLFAIYFAVSCTILCAGQNVGIGTTTPSEKLEVAGNIKTSGEIKPNGTAGTAGQVLTSNGNGTMQWMSAKTADEGAGAGPWSNWCTDNVIEFFPATHSNGQASDVFGKSVSISGDYAIVGSPNDSEGALVGNGTATIFKRNAANGMWESQGRILNPGAQSSEEFGASVSISGDYAIAGAAWDTEGGFGASGSATVFKRNASTGVWESQGKLVNPAIASGDFFGYSVSISGDFAIVGAYIDDEGAGLSNNGSATVFKRNSTTGVWESQGKMVNPAAASDDYFGSSVAISGDFAIVGAPNDDEGAGLTDNGSATIFKRNSTTGVWESQGKLVNPSAASSDFFGNSVSISGNYAIVGAAGDDEGAGLTNNGTATIFKRNETTGVWESQGKLINASPASNDQFGNSVAIAGDFAMVASFLDDGTGTATVYRRYGNIWRTVQKITNPQAQAGDFFGVSCSIDASTRRFLVGSTGVQGGMGMVFFGKVK